MLQDSLQEIKRVFTSSLLEVCSSLYSTKVELSVSRTPNLEIGDFGSPVAFKLAKILKKAPNKIASQISSSLDFSSIPYALSFEAKGGFVNLRLKRALSFLP